MHKSVVEKSNSHKDGVAMRPGVEESVPLQFVCMRSLTLKT